MLFGGSWGSTLSLAYAETHAERVAGMILHGIFLMQQSEFDWYYRDGTPLVFPEAAARIHALLSQDDRRNAVGAYHALVTEGDVALRRRALEAWSRWEAETFSLIPNPERIETFTDPTFAEATAGIELHYFNNGGFLAYDGQLIKEADRIRNIPGFIIHGRYGMVCPIRNAIQLHQAWPTATLKIVRDAGHDAAEPGIVDTLIRATNLFSG